MEQSRRTRAIVTALYVNAALLGGVLLVLLSRGGGGMGVGSPAFAAPPAMAPIAGGNGVYLMPAQFSMNTWGCYLLDSEKQTLCAYQFFPGEKQLRFIAARQFRNDLTLPNYNTTPDPNDVLRLGKLIDGGVRGRAEPVAPAGEPPREPPAPAGETPRDPPAE